MGLREFPPPHMPRWKGQLAFENLKKNFLIELVLGRWWFSIFFFKQAESINSSKIRTPSKGHHRSKVPEKMWLWLLYMLYKSSNELIAARSILYCSSGMYCVYLPIMGQFIYTVWLLDSVAIFIINSQLEVMLQMSVNVKQIQMS